MPQPQIQTPVPEPRETPVATLPAPAEAVLPAAPPAQEAPSTPPQPSSPEKTPEKKEAPATPAEGRKAPSRKRPAERKLSGTSVSQKGRVPVKRKRRPSPVPVSMWLLPQLRLPFSSPPEFLRWFLTGINLWAVAAVILCAIGGHRLVGALTQPRLPGVEQALSAGEATGGLLYTVTQTGDREATVIGTWDPETEEAPGPELAAALCAALSPEEIYGHSDHLYRAIASRFFDGEDFDLSIVLREREPDKLEKDWEPPEPVFSLTRRAGAADWPQPECSASFARQWREAYNGYWLFGQGRKEELGPPQSDPIIEVGDLPPEEPSGEEEAPPLPDLEPEPGDGPGEETVPDGEAAPEESSENQPPDAAEPDGEISPAREEEAPQEEAEPQGLERFFQWVLGQAKKYRAKSFEGSSSSLSAGDR